MYILAVRNVGTSMFLECYIIKGRVNGRVVIALAQQSFQDKSPQLLTFVVVLIQRKYPL